MPVTNEQIISWIPQGHKAALSDHDLSLIISQDFSFENGNNQIVVSKNGKEFRNNTTMAPIPAQDVIKNYFIERKWIDQNKDGGGVNLKTAGDIKNISAFTEHWISQNPGTNTISPEFDKALADHSKGHQDFDWYK